MHHTRSVLRPLIPAAPTLVAVLAGGCGVSDPQVFTVNETYVGYTEVDGGTIENFTHGEVEEEPEDTGDASSSYYRDYTASGYEYELDLHEIDETHAWMEFEGLVLYGTLEGESWVFTDLRQSETAYVYTYGEDYNWETVYRYDYMDTLTFRLDGDTLRGDETYVRTYSELSREPDVWTPGEDAPDETNIEIYDVLDADGENVYNDPLVDDCEGDHCEYGSSVVQTYLIELTGEAR